MLDLANGRVWRTPRLHEIAQPMLLTNERFDETTPETTAAYQRRLLYGEIPLQLMPHVAGFFPYSLDKQVAFLPDLRFQKASFHP